MKIARIFGIDIILEFGFVILLVLIGASFYVQFASAPLNFNWKISIMGAIAAAVLLAFSALFHEMAHSLMAKRQGIYMKKISFFFFGGAAQFTNASLFFEKPGREFKITVVGPLSSLLLAGIFFVASSYIMEPAIIFQVLKNLAIMNLILAAFNLIPGFPADGGRILRSIIWKANGNLSQATTIAVIISCIAWVATIIGVGIFYGAIQAAWIALIAFLFIIPAAFTERGNVIFIEKYKNILVKEVMEIDHHLQAVTIEEYLSYFMPRNAIMKTFPVCSPDDKILDVLDKYPRGRYPLILVVNSQNLVVGRLWLTEL